MALHRKAGGQGRHRAQATMLTANREAIEYELHHAPPITLRSPELGGKGRAKRPSRRPLWSALRGTRTIRVYDPDTQEYLGTVEVHADGTAVTQHHPADL